MDWKDVGAKIVKSAPLIGTILGGPAGGAIGGVVSIVASALGLKPEEATPEKIDQILSADPQAALKLKELEIEYKTELAKLALESDRAFLQDTADARKRDIELTRATGRRDWAMYSLAGLVTGGFFVLCGLLMKYPLPAGSNEVVFMLFGSLGAGFIQVMNYFFGSSKGSNEKTQLMAINNKK